MTLLKRGDFESDNPVYPLEGIHRKVAMGQPDEEARQAPHSLTPVQLEATSDADDLAKMHRGGRLRMASWVGVAAIVLVGGIQLLRMMDANQAYSVAAAQLERSDTEQRDAFTRCALPMTQRAQLAAPNALRDELTRVTERMEKGYGRVLTSCAPLLEAFQQSLRATVPPQDVKPQVEGVQRAGDQLAKAWLDLNELLRRPGATYDAGATGASIDKISTAWQQYVTARDNAKQALSARM